MSNIIVKDFNRSVTIEIDGCGIINYKPISTIKPTIQEDKFPNIDKLQLELALFDKLDEEVKEFKDSFLHKNELEEAFDIIQIVYNILDLKGFSKSDIQEGIRAHNEKLENRGWRFK